MPSSARAGWIGWGIGLGLGLPAIVGLAVLVSSLIAMTLSSRHDVPAPVSVALVVCFAVAAAAVPAWFLIVRGLRDAGVRSLFLGLAILASVAALCAFVAGAQVAASPRESGAGFLPGAIGSLFAVTALGALPLGIAAVWRERRVAAVGQQPHA